VELRKTRIAVPYYSLHPLSNCNGEEPCKALKKDSFVKEIMYYS